MKTIRDEITYSDKVTFATEVSSNIRKKCENQLQISSKEYNKIWNKVIELSQDVILEQSIRSLGDSVITGYYK